MVFLSRSDNSILARWWWTVDRWNLIQILILAAIGIMMVWASTPSIVERYNDITDIYHFLKRHIFFLFIGTLLMLFLSFMSIKGIYRIGVLGFSISLVLLICVMLFGENFKGATRWLDIGIVTIQPSEFIKPFFVLITASLLSQKSKNIEGFPKWINYGHISLLFLIIVLFFLFKQPDFGMAILIVLMWFGQQFLVGLSFRWVLVLISALTSVMLVGYHFFEHVKIRIDSFLYSSSSGKDQLSFALKAYENGSILENLIGKGAGKGTIKKYIPDAHTDFIFPVIAEEFGAIICFFIILLFGSIVLRGFWRVINSSNLYQLLAAGGLLMLFGMQVLINISVTLSLIPTTGMTLPFISYGGSSLISSSICMGIMLALTRKT